MASILIVDDESDMCAMLQAILEDIGHDVLATTDSQAVGGITSQRNFDMFIVDIMMPRRDGTDVVLELRKSFPDAGIIAMSGAQALRRQLYLEAGKQLGADASFEKPFKKDAILASVAEVLHKAALRKNSSKPA